MWRFVDLLRWSASPALFNCSIITVTTGGRRSKPRFIDIDVVTNPSKICWSSDLDFGPIWHKIKIKWYDNRFSRNFASNVTNKQTHATINIMRQPSLTGKAIITLVSCDSNELLYKELTSSRKKLIFDPLLLQNLITYFVKNRIQELRPVYHSAYQNWVGCDDVGLDEYRKWQFRYRFKFSLFFVFFTIYAQVAPRVKCGTVMTQNALFRSKMCLLESQQCCFGFWFFLNFGHQTHKSWNFGMLIGLSRLSDKNSNAYNTYLKSTKPTMTTIITIHGPRGQWRHQLWGTGARAPPWSLCKL